MCRWLPFAWFLMSSGFGCSHSPAQPPAEAPASAPAVTPPSPALSPALTQAVSRVHALLADPNSDAVIQGAFSTTFLAAVPPDKVKAVSSEAKSNFGVCSNDTVVSTKGDTHAVVRIQCERGAINATITVNPAPPYLMEGLLLRPAGP